MAQPFDYGVNIPDPAQAFKQAYEMGTVITNQRLAQEKAQREAEQQKQIQESFARLRQPGATARDYANLSMLLPEAQAKSVRESFGMLSTERQQTALQQSGQVFSAFKSGNPEIAIRYLDQQIEGKRNSGDEAGAKFLETWRDVAKVDPKSTEDYFGYTISQMPGGDKVITSAIALGGEGRAAAQAKPTLEKLVFEALEAGVKAEFARPLAQANLDKLNKEKLAPAVQEAIDFANLTADQKLTFQSLQILRRPPGAVTNVNVTNLDKTAAGELGKLVPDLYNQINSAATQLSDIPRYKSALDKAITGPFANQILTGARIANAFGFTGDSGINATREMIQGLSEMALKSRSMMTGQGAITEGEQKLLIQARSGDINFTKGEIKTILNVAERAAKSQYDQSNKLLKSAATQSPTAQMFLNNVQQLPSETPAPLPASATIKGKTYSRPATFSDVQWRNYLIAEGVIK